MPKGIAVTLGLNAVDPKHYGGWSGKLNACEADAGDMADIARTGKFAVKTLLTKAATRANLGREIGKAAKTLKSGDIFMLTYSGHGGQLPDLNGDEPDAMDETWCLYDGELVDDELYALLGKFAKGVRILVFSDSCHSGTVVKMAYYSATAKNEGAAAGANHPAYRNMPREVALRTYRDNRKFYDPILQDPKLKDVQDRVKASVMLISGCQDNQLSSDGAFNGLFTATLLQVWNHGQFSKSYRAFHRAIVNRMPPSQTPNYFRMGEIDAAFDRQKPFTI